MFSTMFLNIFPGDMVMFGQTPLDQNSLYKKMPREKSRHEPVQLIAALLAAIALFIPQTLQAQHGGGGGRGMMSTGGGTGSGRPDGISEKDEIKNFHRAMAVQATAEQRAAFAKVAQYAEVAIERLQTFRAALRKSVLPDRTPLDQAVEQARAGNQNFLTSFSAKQKSDLEDVTKKLAKADSELDKQIKSLDQIFQSPQPSTEQISTSAAALDQSLSSFQNEQLTLGREMSILFDPAGEGIVFSLPSVSNSINVDGQPIAILASGAVSRTTAATSAPDPNSNATNIFHLTLVDDLSNLQQNVAGLLRSSVNRGPRCGERIQILDATITPLAPASLVVTTLHFERWVCAGQSSPMEVADGDATMEIKLTPSITTPADPTGPSTGLTLASEITRVEAQGLLHSLLRSGDLGISLRDKITASILTALQKGSDLKTTLPPSAQQSATLQQVQFQDDGADQLSLSFNGQLKFTDEQTKQFTAEIKQRISAQATPQP
jgi:hypothetical protein